jgi:endonuclease-3
MSTSPGPRAGLPEVVETLRRHTPVPEPITDPLRLVLWENIGYLIEDSRRNELLGALEAAVGCGAAAIAAADDARLWEIARRGGMRPADRVGRWREIAGIVLEQADGDLDRTLRALPVPKARALLKRFPSIGDPGADKVLLFSGVAPRPSVESNGLRVLTRLGFVTEQASYAASYREAVGVLSREGRPDRDWLTSAYLVLREHGKALCRRAAPDCLACPGDALCAHAVTRGL